MRSYTKMKKAADEAGIPEEAFQVDYAALIHDVMAEVFPELAADAAAPPAEQAPTGEETAPASE